MKGIVVQTRDTRKGKLHRVRTRQWVFVPNQATTECVVTAEGARFRGKNSKDLLIAASGGMYEIDIEKAYASVKKYASKASLNVPDVPSYFFTETAALLWLMGRKAILKKFLSWKSERQMEYIKNPYYFYYRGHLDYHSAKVISERTLCPAGISAKVNAHCLHVLEEAYKEGRESLSVGELADRITAMEPVGVDEVLQVFSSSRKISNGKVTINNDLAWLSSIYYLSVKSQAIMEDNPKEEEPLFKTDDENILKLMANKFTVLSGTAGTGKSTLLRKIAGQSDRIVLSATTGKAAKLLGSNASTVHNLLGFGHGGFKRDKINCDLLIVDESSMLDWRTLYAILKAAPRVVFSGDPEQLPPVGGESVFRKMIEILPAVKLEKIWRYKGTISDRTKVYPVDNPFNAMRLVKKIAETLAKQGKAFQVITPLHGGPLGTTRLNAFLRGIVNPKGEELRDGFRMGDKVMITGNVYCDGELLASNGQIGIVSKKDEEYIGVRTSDGLIMFYPREIDLAYALTVHKFQGSESDYVIFVIPPGMDMEFLTDEMIFVGQTRGRNMTYIIDGMGVM